MDKEKEIENKSLTVKELQALEVGEWVWIKWLPANHSEYQRKVTVNNYEFSGHRPWVDLVYSDYGKKWLAYKNKEEAEGVTYGNVEEAVKEFATFIHGLVPIYGKSSNQLALHREIDKKVKEFCDRENNNGR